MINHASGLVKANSLHLYKHNKAIHIIHKEPRMHNTCTKLVRLHYASCLLVLARALLKAPLDLSHATAFTQQAVGGAKSLSILCQGVFTVL